MTTYPKQSKQGSKQDMTLPSWRQFLSSDQHIPVTLGVRGVVGNLQTASDSRQRAGDGSEYSVMKEE